MKIEYTLADRTAKPSTEIMVPEPVLRARPPRITCLLALAHHCEELVRSGQVKDDASLAALGRASRARISQIMKLLTLTPSIQEEILLLPPRSASNRSITERDLRTLVREPRWDRQRALFEQLLPKAEPPPDD